MFVCRSTARQLIAGLGAVLSVLATGSCMGWITPVLKSLLLPDNPIFLTHAQSSWMTSIIELGNLFSIIPAAFLFNSCGRKTFILSTGPIYLLGWVIIYYSSNILLLCAARFVQGLSMGIVFTVVPVYLGEISSPNLRGAICSMFQVGLNLGLLLEYCIGPFLSYYQLIIITSVIPLLSFAFSIYLPESPYYLVMNGQYTDAYRSLAWLRGTNNTDFVKEEMQEIVNGVEEEKKNKVTLIYVIKNESERRALLIVQTIGIVKIFSGIMAILSYSTLLFSESQNSLIRPDIYTIIIGTLTLLSSFFSSTLTDKLGRRPLLITSTITCSFPLFFVGSYFYLKKERIDLSGLTWIPPVSIMFYCIMFAFGLDPVVLSYRSEMFSTNTRGIAACISTVTVTIAAFLTLKFYLVIADSYGLHIVYWIFSSVCIFGSVYIYLFAIETKGKTLGEIQKQMKDLADKKKVDNSSVSDTRL